jgi:cold shock CspA family protein
MRYSGTLQSWEVDRGFGFIAPTDGGAKLFVHISQFGQDGTRPTIGEKLSYEIGQRQNGQPQAVKVIRKAVGISGPQSRPVPPRPREEGLSFVSKFILMLLTVVIGAYAFREFRSTAARDAGIATADLGNWVSTPVRRADPAMLKPLPPEPNLNRTPERTAESFPPRVVESNQVNLPSPPPRPIEPLPVAPPPIPRSSVESSNFHCDGRTYCSQMTSCAEATYFLNHCPNTKMDGDHDGIPCESQWCTGPFGR